MNILGIGGLLGHDSNAALIMGDRLVMAAQEERYTRVKHDSGFPQLAINDCLKSGNLRPEDIDLIVLAEKPFQIYLSTQLGRSSTPFVDRLANSKIGKRLTLSFFEKEIQKKFPNAVVKYAWHHFSHAISSYYSSGFEKAAFLCIDGKGEFANASIGYIDHEQAVITHELDYANGLGMLYTILSHFLGFPAFGSEYKVMGLAPYGRPKYADKVRSLFEEREHGAIRLRKNTTFHPADIAKLMPWVSTVLGIPCRLPDNELEEIHTDIAASLQMVFEETVLKMAAFAKHNFPVDHLLFCGGCAQNCVAAGKLRDSKIFDLTYNSPVGGDMASGLGAAVAYLHQTKTLAQGKIDFKGYPWTFLRG